MTKNNMAGYTLEKVLQNGIEVYSLEVEPDFSEAQDILDISHVTEDYDAECAYNERVSNDFVATYKHKIERSEDYSRFVETIRESKNNKSYELRKFARQYFTGLFMNNEISENDYYDREGLSEIFEEMINNDKILNFRFPTFEEWKSGLYCETEKRKSKLGKLLKKIGFPQPVIDFYSVQIKEERDIFLTISDLPQHILGMSNYAKIGTFDGYNGTSCQDTRHGYHETFRLIGSLHDNKLFIGMLHYDIEDLEDMTDKLVARTIFRLVHIDEKPCLISTNYYGNNTTKDMLDNVLKGLLELDIYSNDVFADWDRRTTVMESANGLYTSTVCDEVYICEEYERDEMVTCPACNGDCELDVYSSMSDSHVCVSCPACHGSGEVETSVSVYIDEYIEVESEIGIEPYAEGYNHCGGYIEMRMNVGFIENARRSFEVVNEEVTV